MPSKNVSEIQDAVSWIIVCLIAWTDYQTLYLDSKPKAVWELMKSSGGVMAANQFFYP